MSVGAAFPTLDLVAPGVAFPTQAPPVDLYAVPDAGAAQVGDAAAQASTQVSDAATQVSDAVSHGLQEAGQAALEALGTLSGVLLAGRAAMLTTRVLASAAVRAAEEQRCLERQEALSATAAEQWEAAAYAVARANARRTALLARHARAKDPGGGGQGPPRPDLPPPLDPVSRPLGALRADLVRFEEAVRRAEAAQTDWEVGRLTDVMDEAGDAEEADEADDTWRRLIRERREAMVSRHLTSRDPGAEQAGRAPVEPPRATADAERDTDAVRRLGADILAALDPQAAPETVELAAASVGRAARHAAENPTRARRHLGEARKFVQDANRRARARRAEEEWAAAQLDFLTRRAPEDAEPLPEAPDAERSLRRLLEDGMPLTPEERRLVELRVTERLTHLEALYVRAQLTEVMTELAARYGGPADATCPEGQELRLDWTPEGWGPDHWLRATLVRGTLRIATMYRGGPGERRPEDRAVDDERCAEARRRIDEFAVVARELGLDMDVRIEQTEGARPGLPGEDGTVVLDGALGTGTRRRAPDHEATAARKHRTVGDRTR
ncbi:hypothetical protein [Streptomyces sp. NPDC057363]|uniref:hypothetical protein n=1 Tax=Streptomyces sp. NPDC057363 TaxID=3346107 RepID=UPI00363C3781